MARFQLVGLILLSLTIIFSASFFVSAAQPSNAPPDRASGLLIVANKGEHTMGIIDPIAGTQVAIVPENGVTGHELIASADGKLAFVPIYGDSGVGKPGSDGSNMIVVDIASRKIVGNVDFGKGVRPHCAMLGPKDGMLYVTTEIDKAVSVIDPKTFKIVGSVPTGQAESHMLAISHDGKLGYTANVGPGTISVLDMVGRKTLEVIPISPQIQRISVSMDDKWVFTSEVMEPKLAVLDTSTRKVKTRIPLPAPGYGSSPTPDGRWLVIALPAAHKVAVIDLKAMTVAHTIDVPAAPQETLVTPDGKTVYVSCDASHKVAAIRTSDWTVEKLIDAGAGVDGLAWAGK